jgi:hypothetical protein
MKKYIQSIIVCWRCKKGGTLLKCSNDIDYVCSRCASILGQTSPEIGNQSKIYVKSEMSELPKKKGDNSSGIRDNGMPDLPKKAGNP